MQKRIAHIVFSCWLAIVLVFGTTPMEFLHTFTHHKDTVHHSHELSFENQHHHCTFLGFELMPFDNSAQVPYIPYIASVYNQQSVVLKLHYVQRNIIRASLRGPPVV